jgi:LysR family glycine cleavage system transcriptional activator
MQKLPPLNGMKAFEASGRTGSFALAARELGVSPAAVSQQVKNLETWFGKQLFIRTGNRIALTDAGQAIYPQTYKAFSDIADMAQRLSEGEMRPRFVVSVPFSLAEFWLAPRLAKLLDLYPHMTFDVRVEDDPVDMKRNAVDIRISYGEYDYAGLTAIPLLHDDVLPVCAPEFWYRHGGGAIGLSEVQDSMFIHTNWGETYASHPSWADWFARTGSKRRPDPASGRRVGLSSLAITTARLGLGIALGQRSMALPDLEAGRLIALSSTSVRLGHPYRALLTKAKAERPDIVNFIAMLGKV